MPLAFKCNLYRYTPAALVLQSPFTSIQDIARDKAGPIAYALVSERWATKSNLCKVRLYKQVESS
jgi:hypothetical protein